MRVLFSAVLMLVLSGCAYQPPPPTWAQIADDHLKNGRWLAAYQSGLSELSDKAILEKLKDYPDFSQKFAAALVDEAQQTQSASRIAYVRKLARGAVVKGALSPADQDSVEDVVRAQITGDLALEALSEPELNDLVSEDVQREFVVLALRDLEQGQAGRLSAFTRVIAKHPLSDAEMKRLEKAVLRLNLTRQEVESKGLPPNIVAKYIEQHAKPVRIVSDDRLIQEDVISAVNERGGWVSASREGGGTDVVVAKLQWDMRVRPDTTNTVSYASHQVDLLAAALLMPKNATYMYDIVSGGADLSYAFEVKANGRDRLIRNQRHESYSRCQGARIMNVFGGVQPADFVANDHMKSTCSGGRSSVDPSQLRREAIREIADAVLALVQ